MIKLITLFFLIVLLTSSVYAKDNFSEMSTQELISIIGYVKEGDVRKFKAELKSREKNMNASEKKMYKANLKKKK